MAEGSIARTLRVLQAVCEHGPSPLKALSEQTELAPPTLLRILRLMESEGFVTQQADRRWRGTMLVWRLGCAVNTSVGISTLSREYTDRLTAELDETSVYAVYEQGSVTYAAHSEPTKPVRAHIRLGRRYGLLSTTTGQVVLAFLEPERVEAALAESAAEGIEQDPDDVRAMLAETRRTGYRSGVGIRWPELWGAAAPVFDSTGKPVGALGVSLPAARAESAGDSIIAAVVREAAQLSHQLGAPERSLALEA